MQSQHYFVGVVLFVAATFAGHPVQAKTFLSSKGYQISTPESWITSPGPCDSKVTTVFYCGKGENGNLSIPAVEVMARPAEVMTMAKLASYAPRVVAGTFPQFHQTSAVYTSLDGVSTLDIRGTYPRHNRTVYIRELFAIRSGEAYIITTGYPAERRTSCEAVSTSVIRSLRWR